MVRCSKWWKPAAALLAALVACAPAFADPPERPEPPREPWRETWFGADVGPTYWSLYNATVWSPYGEIVEPGLRIRVASTYGRYHYDSSRIIAGQRRPTRFEGVGATADAMVGYQWRFGTLTAKLYGGIVGVGHTVTPFDAGNEVQGYKIGAAGALELWWDVRPSIWASLDLTGAGAFPQYTATARVGWRVLPGYSLGLEGHVSTDGREERGRFGALARIEWNSREVGWMTLAAGEATVAGGVAVDGDGDGDGNAGGWARLNLLLRY